MGARIAVMIGDATMDSFYVIVLLAGLRVCPRSKRSCNHGWCWRLGNLQGHHMATLLPVSATIVLIRLIEAFKIIDLPNVMTNGGPGIATESLSLHFILIGEPWTLVAQQL